MKDKTKLKRKFDRQARIYDKQRKNEHLSHWRSKLLKGANGKVLELAVGAGANFAYYPPGVEVTAIDISPGMLDYARTAARKENLKVEFLLADMEGLTFPDHTFDTIVSTLSFCGYDHPVDLLKRLQHWCKPTGKILLMEHGISLNPLVAGVQKVFNPINHKFIGCHLKRDMLGIMQASNLEIEQYESHWLGMFHLVWASPSTAI